MLSASFRITVRMSSELVSACHRNTQLVPAYNEQDNIMRLYEALSAYVGGGSFPYSLELLFVDDGSTDKTIELIRRIEASDERVRGLQLSRNFGKEVAIVAGLDFAKGDAVILMDADLQHPISAIGEMTKLWELGYQDVYGKRTTRHGESWFKVLSSNLYYKFLNKLTKTQILANVGDFRLLDRQVVDALIQLRESGRYTKGLYEWVGYRKAQFEFEAAERNDGGESKWRFGQLVRLAIDGITSYTIFPLQISAIIGFLVSAAAFTYLVIIVAQAIIGGITHSGIPTIIVLVLFLGGIQLMSLGILGEYLGRIFMEAKGRPLYFINEQTADISTEDRDLGESE